MRVFVDKFCEKSGSFTHPDQEVTEAVILGLAKNVDELVSRAERKCTARAE